MQTRSNDSNVQHLKLDLEYEQTNENIRMLTDVRFKLLAFLPTLGGVAAFALSYLGFTLSENIPQGGQRNISGLLRRHPLPGGSCRKQGERAGRSRSRWGKIFPS